LIRKPAAKKPKAKPKKKKASVPSSDIFA